MRESTWTWRPPTAQMIRAGVQATIVPAARTGKSRFACRMGSFSARRARICRVESMPDYTYLVVGGGMTGDAACRGIRDHDFEGSVGVVGEEPHAPYSRPPLSKALWQGKGEETVWRGTADLGVDLHLGRRIVELDLDGHRAVDDRAETYSYERLLLATGGRPRRLPAGDGDVVYFRSLDDYRRLRSGAKE